MGKASSKKVARAARTGGGRTRRGSSSWFWPAFMAVVVVLGTAGIVYSREQREPDLTPPRPPGEGYGGDHWHAALAFQICEAFAPPIQDQSDPVGIHTHADGVVHVHPFGSRASGARATLGVFFDAVNANVTPSEIRVPGQPTKRDGMRCGERPAEVQVKVWDTRSPADPGRLVDDPRTVRLRDNQLITVAFLPPGEEIRRPPSAANLDRLTDLGPASTTTLPPGGETTTTVTPPTTAATTTTPTSEPQPTTTSTP